MKRFDGTGDQWDGDWINTNNSSASSISQQYSPVTWMNPPTSACDPEGTELLQFTNQPNVGWNTSSADFLQGDTDTQETEEIIDDDVLGKNYDIFEGKLQEGFLEASNLGLTCVPPAMFEYQPPLHRIDLKDNKIEILPEHFFDELPMLRWCDLRYNRLQNIPHMNVEHKNLQVLLLQDNQISELPCTLAYAINLKTLGWSNNCILEPPRQVLLEGCQSIMKYLWEEMARRLPIDEDGNPAELSFDDHLNEDLKKLKAKRSTSRCSISSAVSGKSSSSEINKEKQMQKKRIDRIKYTWGLWQSIPYHGVSSQTLFENSLQEIKNEVETKLQKKKEAILQKMKDTEAVSKWRKEAKMMQLKGSLKPYSGMSMPFGTDQDIRPTPVNNGMDKETFCSTLKDCMTKLRSFSDNPVSLNDTEKSLQRLKEVEDVQRKIFNMKLNYSVKSSNPI